MPQMAPINWLILFIMFSMTLMLFCMINYYSLLPPTPKTFELKKMSNLYSWKW